VSVLPGDVSPLPDKPPRHAILMTSLCAGLPSPIDPWSASARQAGTFERLGDGSCSMLCFLRWAPGFSWFWASMPGPWRGSDGRDDYRSGRCARAGCVPRGHPDSARTIL